MSFPQEWIQGIEVCKIVREDRLFAILCINAVFRLSPGQLSKEKKDSKIDEATDARKAPLGESDEIKNLIEEGSISRWSYEYICICRIGTENNNKYSLMFVFLRSSWTSTDFP